MCEFENEGATDSIIIYRKAAEAQRPLSYNNYSGCEDCFVAATCKGYAMLRAMTLVGYGDINVLKGIICQEGFLLFRRLRGC